MCESGRIARRIMVVVLVVFSLTLAAQGKYSGGSGTAGDPYRIADYNDLYALADDANDYSKCFIMTADIDLDPNLPGRHTLTAALIAPDINGTSSGFQGTRFTGTFDGNDCKILNFRINGKDYLGLFGYLYTGGSVRNLGLDDVNITGTGSYVGGLVGYDHRGNITNCYAGGTVNASGSSVGGLVGYAGYAILNNCSATVAVTGNNGRVGGLAGQCNYSDVTNCRATGGVSGMGSYIGGLAGFAYGGSNMDRCCATGEVIGSGSYVGGLVGEFDGSLQNCYASGAVTGSSYVGGLVGYAPSSSVTNCYASGAVSGIDGYVGGLMGYKTGGTVTNSFWDIETSGTALSAGGMGLTTSEMQQAYYFQLYNWGGTTWTIDEGNEYPHLAWENAPGELITDPVVSMKGSGTAEDPWVIECKDDFESVCAGPWYWNKHYVLNTNIDLSGVRWSNALMGYSSSYVFTGSFDGNDHIISNLTIDGSDYLGLFGYVSTGGSISNLGLKDVNLTSTGSYVGGLAGYANRANITNCYVTGSIRATGSNVGGLIGLGYSSDINVCHVDVQVSGDDYVGGLAGYGEENGISYCYAGGTIRGTDYGGGLVGYSRCSLSNCFATSSTAGNDYVGGLVGYRDGGTVEDCYARGAVSGNNYVGGLIGYADYGTAVTNCYATGLVAGTGVVGGLIGYAYERGSTVLNSFWDVNTSGIAISDGGTGLPTSQMQRAFYFQAYNWQGTTWTIDEGRDYPHLAWENVTGEFIGDLIITMPGAGTSEDPWVIESDDDFALICAGPFFWDKHYVLNTDIDLSAGTYSRGLIGYDYWNRFSGSFDGGGHIIRNLKIEGEGNIGLFGYLDSGYSVSNLGLEDVNISGSGDYVGGLVGYADYDTSITNCHVAGAVRGKDYVGGLVGYADGAAISKCYAAGTVSGNEGVGGLAGDTYDGASLTDCYTTSAVSGNGGVGGLVGSNTGSVTNCHATGFVSASGSYAGGLMGGSHGYEVDTCYATGAVSGQDFVGGLIGRSSSGVSDCHAGGAVSGNRSVGGLVGYNNAGSLANCQASGAVRGNSYAGGLIGTASGYVTNCYATGSVGATGHSAGGLEGYGYSSNNVINCYATGMVGGSDGVGGLVGQSYGTLTNCYSTGGVSGGSYTGGLVGYKGTASTLTACFWDVQTSGTTVSAGGVGLRTLQMQAESTFTNAGWDFNTPVWVMWDGHEYPWLAWEHEPVEVESISVVDKERVGRTVFRYLCKLTLRSTRPQNFFNVSAELIDVPENVTVVDGNVGCASIEAFGTAESEDTFTIEVDRSVAIEPTEMVWSISYQTGGSSQSWQATSAIEVFLDPSGDINGDGKVDYDDLGAILSRWLWEGEAGGIAEDLNGDGRVDFADVAKFGESWQE